MVKYNITTANDLKEALAINGITGIFTINEGLKLNEWVVESSTATIKLLISRFKLIKILKGLSSDLKSIYVERSTGLIINPSTVGEDETQEIISGNSTQFN